MIQPVGATHLRVGRHTGLCLDRPGLSPFSGIAGTQHTIAADEVTGRCDVRYTQRHSMNTLGARDDHHDLGALPAHDRPSTATNDHPRRRGFCRWQHGLTCPRLALAATYAALDQSTVEGCAMSRRARG